MDDDMQGWAHQLELEEQEWEEVQAIKERVKKKREAIKFTINKQRRINDGRITSETTTITAQ